MSNKQYISPKSEIVVVQTTAIMEPSTLPSDPANQVWGVQQRIGNKYI